MIKYTHITVVILFLLIYVVKTVLLLLNKKEQLAKFTKMFRIPEMIISVLFLATGIYLLIQLPTINKFMIIKIIAVLAAIPIAIIGFKKSNKGLASLALLLIIAAYGLAEMSTKARMKGNADQATDASNGEIIYLDKCANCHGKDGSAGLSNAADLSMSQMDDTGISGIIASGKNNMPAFSSQLSPQQMNAVAQYVKTLRK